MLHVTRGKLLESGVAVSAADVEPATSHDTNGAQAGARSGPPYDCHVHSVRKRLGDIDGISAKAAIDGIVKAALLIDDSAKYIKSIRFTQEQGEPEETIVDFT